jgi:hypothetical protein
MTMKVLTISYQRKRADGAYGNRSLQVTAEIEEGEDPSAVTTALRAFVDAELERDVAEEALRARAQAEAHATARLREDPLPDDDPDDEEDDDALPF